MANTQDNQEKTFFIPYIVNIPGRVLESGISRSCLKLFSLLVGLSSQYGYSWATNEELAEHFEVSEKTIEKWFKILRDKNFIRCEYKQLSYRSASDHLRWKKDRKTFVTPAFECVLENSKNVCETRPNGGVPPIPAQKGGLLNIKQEKTNQEAPSAVGKISIIQEKKSVLEQLPLTESQIMSLTRNYELDQLKNAVNFYKLQEIKPDNLFGWISSCIKHKYWQNVLNGHKTQKELMANRSKEEVRCSLVEVLKGLDERFKGVIGHQFAKNKKESDIWIKNDYYFVEWDLMNKAKCHELAKKITLSLNENVQVVYNEIPCNNKFEILEDKWK